MLLFLLSVSQVNPQIQSINPYPTFQMMLDSAKIVIIAKVDSMWFTGDEHSMPRTHYLAELLALYTRSDSFPVPRGTVHIVEEGGIGSDGRAYFDSGEASYDLGEVFLAAIREYHWKLSDTEVIFTTTSNAWKYTITNDSIRLAFGPYGFEPKTLSIAEVICALSSHFNKKAEK